jgi:hypothetical protein
MKNRLLIGLILVTALCMLTLSCSQPAAVDVNATITNVGWFVNTTPNDWWSASSTYKPLLVYNFNIYFSGNISASDIEYARVYLPGSTTWWTLDHANGFNAAGSVISGSGFWYSDNLKELPIGNLNAEIKLLNGKISDMPFTVGYPGSINPGSNSYVYSSDDEKVAAYPSVSKAALRRPSVTSLIYSGGGSPTVTVSFIIRGTDVHNGFIWYYDSLNNYIGRSPYFRDANTGADSSNLSGGTFNRNDGSTNTHTVYAADLIDGNGAVVTSSAFTTIAKCRVVVFDGLQYESLPSKPYIHYDFRAVSSLAP